MSDTDNWYTCKLCHQAFERWQGANIANASRCKPCSEKRSGWAKRYYSPTANCRLCGVEFLKPTTREGSRVFCTTCYDIDPRVRDSILRERKGLPPQPQRFAQKVVVDRKEYINVHSLMHESLEKMVRKIADRNVVLVR